MENFDESEVKTVVITGATSGIGKAIALKMAALGYKLIIIARDETKIKQLLHEITHKTNNIKLKYYIVDLSNLQRVHQVGQIITSENPVIDILINNAGIFSAERKVTKEGFELTFATNYLGPFLLTHSLLNSLCKSNDAQILNVSSSAHFMGRVHWNDLGMAKRWFGFKAYGQSKLLVNLFSFELARKLSEASIRVNAIHPGVVRTNLGGNGEPLKTHNAETIMGRIVNKFGISPEESAQAIVNVLTEKKFQKTTGKYFSMDKLARSSLKSRKKEDQKKIWDVSYTMLKRILDNNENLQSIELCS
jgi:NAD(P)-dependent dehydrogenase (short-subunit alcohol dehydrogenase family)